MPSSVSKRGVWGQPLWGWLALAALVLAQGCATHSAGFAKIEQEAAKRNIPGALLALEDFHKNDLTSADRTLAHLNRGTLLRLKGDYAASNQEFDTAKRLMEELAATSVTEQAASVAVNDTAKAYEGDANEQLLVYAMKSLNYLQSGDFDAAAVEARQFDIKHRLIMEQNPDAKYLSGAFVRYLNAMVYEAVGESDSARIEYQKAMEGYKEQSAITGLGVPAALKIDLARLEAPRGEGRAKAAAQLAAAKVAAKTLPDSKSNKSKRAREQVETVVATVDNSPPPPTSFPATRNGEVVFFLHNGLGPSLAENIIQLPNPAPQAGAALLRVALPKFVQRPAPVARVELGNGTQSASSELVEDVNAIARKSLEDRLPAIQARALARLVVKNVAVAAAKKRNENAGSYGLLMSLGADIAAIASERADTRSWSLLPGNIQLARLSLPAGTHDLKASFYSASGSLLGTREYKGVIVRPERKSFVADYYLEMAANQVR
jgi:uncharacterized protein